MQIGNNLTYTHSCAKTNFQQSQNIQHSAPSFRGQINDNKKPNIFVRFNNYLDKKIGRFILQTEYSSQYRSDKKLQSFSTNTPVLKAELAAYKYSVNAKYSDNYRLATATNSVLDDLHQKGYPLPQNVWSYDLDFDNSGYDFLKDIETSEKFGTCYPGKDTISLNSGLKWGMMDFKMQEMHAQGITSSENPNHFILHQIGHFLQDNNNHELALDHDGIEFKNPEFIEKSVSKIAASNHNNFVAEVFAGKISGKNYDETIMNMFKKFGGVFL